MKEFVKTMLAVICAFIVLRILRLLFFIVFLGAAVGGSSPKLPRSGVLDLDMSAFTLAEQTQEASPDAMSLLSGGEMVPVVGLRNAVKALDAAALDPGVKYVLLRADGVSAGVASLEEFRLALSRFRESGKAVVAYTESPGNGSYYLSSAADKIIMGSQHGGTPQLLGLSSQLLFLKDILDKVGVHVQLIRHGKYKSAGEMYIRSSASPENREQYQVMVNSLWKTFAGDIAASRDMTEEQFNALVDNLALNFPEDFLQNGLVDEILDHEGLVAKLCSLAMVEDVKDLHLIPFVDYADTKVKEVPARNNVAVIYADGEIVDGKGLTEIAGDRFVQVIDQVRKDKSVKAVVLRVNSPGGSVSASVKIREALDLLQKEKPLVASYGNYAASGGYWISNGCQKIYADRNTITGSIGVFSMIPEISEVAKKVGVGLETVNSNKHSDMLSLTRPFDAQELDFMQASVEDIYESFVNLVAESRGQEPEAIDAIAQGRVWAGTDALEIGLVDEIGTLEDAIQYVAALADMVSSDEYGVVSYPLPPTFFQQILQGMTPQEPSILSGTPFEGLAKEAAALKGGDPAKAYARLPYSLVIR